MTDLGRSAYDAALAELEGKVSAALAERVDGWLGPEQRDDAQQPPADDEQQQHRVEAVAAAAVLGVLTAGAAAAAAAVLARLGIETAQQLDPQAIARDAATMVGVSAAYQVARARRAVAQAADAAARAAERAAQLDTLKRWAVNVAIQASTYTVSAARENAVAAAVQVSQVVTPVTAARTWVTRHDDKVRPEHAAADGQVRELGAPFDVGGYPMRWPGDTLAPPALTANCRCRVRYTITKGQ